MKRVPVTIMEMEHHFLYLPVYFAREMDFFGEIPLNYVTNIEQAPAATDADAYRRLSRGEAQLAICDPCAMIYAAQQDFAPAVLAGLVVRGAFWAVNTHSPPVAEFEELSKFDHIIAFHPGTTSHGIAKRIVRAAKGNAPVIEAVRPLQELTKLEDLVRDKKSAVALSPDALRIETSREANKDWLDIKLALADTTEYGHLLVTAVLARADFVRDHPAFVSGFLRALQRALIYTQSETTQVLEYASESFNQGQNVVKKALALAGASQVWAPTVAISEDLWLTASHAYHDSIGAPFDTAAKQMARNHFAQSLKPHIAGAQRAAVELVTAREPPKPNLWLPLVFVALGSAIGLFGWLGLEGHTVAQLVTGFCIVCLPTIADFKGKRHLVGFNALLYGLFASVWAIRFKAEWASDEAWIGAVIVLVVLFAETNFKIVRRHMSGE